MLENSWMVLISAILMSLFVLSYLVRIFEKHVDEEFWNMSTAMWLVLITMTTVGYGDFYPQSHMGRFVGILLAFWGAFVTSLFVVSMNNMFDFSTPEAKSYNLLQRLLTKEQMRLHAADMVRAKYKIKIKRSQENGSTLQDEAYWDRNYREHVTQFRTVQKAYRNIGDADGELENVKNSVDMLMNEIQLISKAQQLIYEDLEKMKSTAFPKKKKKNGVWES